MTYDKQLFTNNAISLLASPISSSATTLTVLSGMGALFPNPGVGEYFLITLENQSATLREIIRVNGRTGDTFTGILRGQEGTPSLAWSASVGNDTLVDHRVTAETMRLAMVLPDTLNDLTDVDLSSAPVAGQVLKFNGTAWVPAADVSGGGSGTVSSVALSLPSIFSVSGSPVTTSGTLSATLSAQPARTVLAGPVGAAGIPAFRTLSIDELSDVDTSTSLPTIGQVLSWNGTNWVPVTNSSVLDPDLVSLAGLTGTGHIVRTAPDTYALRTILGTPNRVSVVNGDGVSGNPTIDISASYAGQTSITTLGAVTVGTWNGSTIDIANGGTGRTSIGPANTVLSSNATGTGLEYKAVSGGAGVNVSLTAGSIAIANTGVISVIGTADQVFANGLSGSSQSGAVTLTLPQSIGLTSSPTFSQITVASNPTAALQVATKAYVDSVVEGLDHKQSVRLATSANIVLSGTQVLDGILAAVGDRVLVKNQTAASENGIYIVQTGAWTRASDYASWLDVPGAFTFIEEGSSLSDTAWVSVGDQGGTIDVSPITWTQFSSAASILAGTGLQRIGNVISLANIVSPGGPFNSVSINAQGQVISATVLPYLTSNQTITLTGDVTGSGTTAITTTLAPTGIAPGTYTSLTVDAGGRATAGTNPTTLAGYGIIDAQPLDGDLTSLASLTTTGILVRSATDTVITRAIVPASTKVSVVDGSGVAGNPTIDVNEANISINNLSGALDVVKGGTGLTSLGAANQVLGVNAAGTGAEYKTITGTNITVAHTANSIELTALSSGSVSSVSASSSSSGLTIGGVPITTSGTITFALDTEIEGLLALSNSVGFIAHTSNGTYISRSVVSPLGTVAISNSQGVAGNLALELSTIGTAGTYYSTTTDAYGRVVSGGSTVDWSALVSTPTTLTGYGITDAQPLNSFLTSISGNANAGIVVKNGAMSAVRSIVAGSAKVTVINGDGISGNPTIDIGVLNLGDISNVILSSPAPGQALTFNGTNWVNGSVTPKLYAENPVSEITPVATGTNAIALGSAATAGAHDSLAIGIQSLSRLPGITQANGRFASQGDAQAGTYILRTGTINAVPTEMFLDGTGGNERLVMTTDTTWVFKITITAHRTDSPDRAGFKIDGVILCGPALNSIALLGSPTKSILARTDSNWNAAVTADTTNGSLKISVTGATGHSIRWTAIVETVEVTN